MSISNIVNITKGLTNRNEVCVLNNLGTYGFQIAKPNPAKCVEYPNSPPLLIGEPGFKEPGMCRQTQGQNDQNFGPNIYELIKHKRYRQVKELMGYVGAKTQQYHLYKVVSKETRHPIVYMSCGDFQDHEVAGNIYIKDSGIGGARHVRPGFPILNSGQYQRIYQTLRGTDSGTITWNLSTPQNGMHLLLLRFADFWYDTKSGTITINNTMRRENFNAGQKIGGTFRRYDLPLRVPVINNTVQLTLEGRNILNALELYRLKRDNIDFVLIKRDDPISNKETFLFINKNIVASKHTIKTKFLKIYKTVLPSRDLFFF